MGKAAKKVKKSDVRKSIDPTASSRRPAKKAFQQTPETDALHRNKILPAMKGLSAASEADRATAVANVCTLLEDDTARFLLLKERVVQKLMEETVVDVSEDVVALAWKALWIIAREEGYDHCINMFRRGIVGRLETVLKKLPERIEPVAVNPSGTRPKVAENIWTITRSVIGLLKCLSEESEQALDAISKLELIPLLMGLLRPTFNVPEDVKAMAAQCMSSLTEDNDEFTSKIVNQAEYVPVLLQLKEAKSPIIRIASCAILHNLTLAPSEIENDLSDAQILPNLTRFIKYTASLDLPSYSPQNASKEDEDGLKATKNALEVIASIATVLGYELESAKGHTGPNAFEDDAIKKDADDEEDENEEMADDISALQEDMEMTTGGDKDDPAELSHGGDELINYLLETTMPVVIALSKPLSEPLRDIQISALTALNNIAWTLNIAIPIPEGKPTGLSAKWAALIQNIWSSVVSPVLAANTADIALADGITSVAWAVSKAAHGRLDTSGEVHKGFIALYQAATSDELRSKCVGVLGCLAMPQDRLGVNKDIGVFLLGLINEIPNTPVEPGIEALNAIFDIYADAEYAYDRPVFVELGFLQYLEQDVPKVRRLAKKVDRNKFPELRARADEVLMNLGRFIQYKKKEAKKSMEAE